MSWDLLQLGSRGRAVEEWQSFLVAHGESWVKVDGTFGHVTTDATKLFQGQHNLPTTGILDAETQAKARELGFGAEETEELSPNWPPPPDFPPLLGLAAKQALFGTFTYVSHPTLGNPEGIRITNDWAAKNLVGALLPAKMVGKPGARSRSVVFHKAAVKQFNELWEDWEEQDLLQYILSWEGSYAPRFIRGSRSILSNHAFATAFDINAASNQLGKTPALVGTPGSVRKLVQTANKHGFYWGGHWKGRPDGMHFEVAELL